jgi:hypothetical protein
MNHLGFISALLIIIVGIALAGIDERSTERLESALFSGVHLGKVIEKTIPKEHASEFTVLVEIDLGQEFGKRKYIVIANGVRPPNPGDLIKVLFIRAEDMNRVTIIIPLMTSRY